MNVNKEFLEKMVNQSKMEMEKAKNIFERNQGVINFCQFLLKDLEKEKQNVDDSPGVKPNATEPVSA